MADGRVTSCVEITGRLDVSAEVLV